MVMCSSCSLLLVEDDDELREILARRFSRRGLRVVGADTAEGALAAVEQQAFDIALLDRSLHGQDSLELISRLKRICPAIRVIVLSGRAGGQSAAEAILAGACEYLVKPSSLADLELAIQRAGGAFSIPT